MQTPASPPLRALRRAAVAAAALAAALLPSALPAHTTVEWTRPAADTTLAAGPAEVRLRFAAPVEPALTVLTLLRGDGHVAAGGRVAEGSGGREYVLELPAPLEPGSYRVTWRTVGADGHVLQGSWAFAVAAPEGEAEPLPPPPAAEPPPEPVEPVERVVEPVGVAVRWVWFASLLGMIGAVSFRFGVLGRLEREEPHREVAARAEHATWLIAFVAAAFSTFALLGRLWVQADALAPGAAWETETLRLLLTRTGWGIAWTLQATATFAFFVGLVVARAPYGRSAGWMGAGVGAILLSTVPALTGHATTVGDWAGGAILADALHVLGAGVWLGTLLAILAVGIPAALSSPAAGSAVTSMVGAFSPLALAGAGLVGVTGVASALFQLGAPADLWATAYGRTLLLKLLLVAGVAALGAYNWRRVRPALGDEAAIPPLRRSVRAELALGALVLLVTAALVALPTP
jgi:copper transport protein